MHPLYQTKACFNVACYCAGLLYQLLSCSEFCIETASDVGVCEDQRLFFSLYPLETAGKEGQK